MNIYVKECPAMDVASLVPWFKKTNAVQVLDNTETLKDGDIIVISNTDKNIKFNLSEYNVIVYEDIFEKIAANILEEYRYNYDFYYIKNALKNAANANISTVISGSSYGVFGIDLSNWHNAVNLAAVSQDLYYSTKLIYSACESNTNIKNIVLCMGYYYFFCNLSKTQNVDELLRITKVYDPLLQDIHDCVLLPPKKTVLYKSEVFDVEGIAEQYALSEYAKGYFHENRPREKFALKMWEDKNKNWNNLSTIEKEEAGRNRAETHNRSAKRESSLLENITYFQKFLHFCNNRSINVLLVVTPCTTYYLEHLNPEFKSVFYDVLDKTEGILHLLDLADDTSFTDEDFNDTDHLNDNGAKKMTEKILRIIQEIEMSPV